MAQPYAAAPAWDGYNAGAYAGYAGYSYPGYGTAYSAPAGPAPPPLPVESTAGAVPPPPPSPPKDAPPGVEAAASGKNGVAAAGQAQAPGTADAQSAEYQQQWAAWHAYYEAQQQFNAYTGGGAAYASTGPAYPYGHTQAAPGYGVPYGAPPQQAQWPGYGPGHPPQQQFNMVPSPHSSQPPSRQASAQLPSAPMSRGPSIPQQPQSMSLSTQGSTGTTYNAVPPPTHLTHAQRPVGKVPMVVRPQIKLAVSTTPASAPVASEPTAPAPRPAVATVLASKPQQPPAGTSSKFPPTFTGWVERCFTRCRTDRDRQLMTASLTSRIKEVEGSGRMWLIDWDREPIPMVSTAPDLPSPGAGGAGAGGAAGLRSKRTRWEESQAAAASAAQLHGNDATGWQVHGKKRKQGKWVADEDTSGYGYGQGAEVSKRQQRAGRFGDGRAMSSVHNGRGGHRRAAGWRRGWDEADDRMRETDDEGEGFDASSVHIQGTCTVLEKSYFRLTSAPDPSVVRPPAVLRQALDRLVGMLRDGSSGHFYALDQFKGMRQDCTVQHLRNELAVQVYEAHARESLEYGDMAEFNQCQTQLASLYGDGVPGCTAEFLAYKILYNTVHAGAGAGKALLATLKSALASPPSPAVANALAARAAVFTDNAPAFFAAYAAAPALGRALLDVLAPRVRWAALNMVVKGYKAPVPVDFLARMLGFITPAQQQQHQAEQGSGVPLPGCRQPVFVGRVAGERDTAAGMAACVEWLKAHGAVLEGEGGDNPQVDVKASVGKLFIPEEPAKVAHGDENLSLEDFLSRASGLGS